MRWLSLVLVFLAVPTRAQEAPSEARLEAEADRRAASDHRVIVDLVVEVTRDGSVGEVGASRSSRWMRRCLERAVAEAIAGGTLGRARGPRRLLLLAIGGPER